MIKYVKFSFIFSTHANYRFFDYFRFTLVLERKARVEYKKHFLTKINKGMYIGLATREKWDTKRESYACAVGER